MVKSIVLRVIGGAAFLFIIVVVVWAMVIPVGSPDYDGPRLNALFFEGVAIVVICACALSLDKPQRRKPKHTRSS